MSRRLMEIAEHVRRLRRVLRLAVVCPKCGREGVVSVLERGRYKYLIVRHRDGSTHTLTPQHAGIVLEELCRIRRELETACP